MGVRKFIVPCEFGDKIAPFAIYIGEPKPDTHPVQHQNTWLSKERGGAIPERVRSSLEKLHELARKNGLCFADLCVYALTLATHNKPSDDKKDSSP